MTFGEVATVVIIVIGSAIAALWCAAVLACAGFIAFTLAASIL